MATILLHHEHSANRDSDIFTFLSHGMVDTFPRRGTLTSHYFEFFHTIFTQSKVVDFILLTHLQATEVQFPTIYRHVQAFQVQSNYISPLLHKGIMFLFLSFIFFYML